MSMIVHERYTANVCRDLRGLYREMSLQGFEIYRVYR